MSFLSNVVNAAEHEAAQEATAALEAKGQSVARNVGSKVADERSRLQQQYMQVAAQYGHIMHQLQDMQAVADQLKKQIAAFNVEFARLDAVEKAGA